LFLRQKWHYLRRASLVGEQCRYAVSYQGQWVALLGWSAAAWHLGPRDEWLGWSQEQRLLELAHLATLQDLGLAPEGGQGAHHLEAVARSFQHDQILGDGMLLGPACKLRHRHFVEYFFHHGGRGRGATQGRGGETVRVSVQANHPLDNFCFFIHLVPYG
jgi:hypothetical protein